MMGSFAERLKALRIRHDLKQKDVAEKLGITTSAYGFYEQGKREPSIQIINQIADLFNVSADYLLGRDESTSEEQLRIEFGKRLKQLRKRKGLTAEQLGERIGVARTTIFGYETGARLPDLFTTKKLAEFFDVSVDYLIGLQLEPPSHDLREVFSRSDLTWEGVPIEEGELKTIRDFTSWILRHKVPYRPET